MTVNKDPGDEYLRRFRGVEPPRELRAKVLGRADAEVHEARSRSRDRWLLGVAALVLVLLTVVNVRLEERVRVLANGGGLGEARVESGGETELVDSLQPSFRLRFAMRRARRVGEQSWLRLSASIERIEG